MESTGLIPFPAFMVAWAAYGLLGLPLYFGRNLTLKRRYLRPYMIGAGALFVGGMLLTGFPVFMVILAVPAVAIVTVVNLKQIQFCERCGATVVRSAFFQKSKFCSRCGAPIEPQPTSG